MFDLAPHAAETFPLHRPGRLARAARRVARCYRRERDLPGAAPGLLSRPNAQIVPRLAEMEARCEEARLARAGHYRAGQHVLLLAALLAESAAQLG